MDEKIGLVFFLGAILPLKRQLILQKIMNKEFYEFDAPFVPKGYKAWKYKELAILQSIDDFSTEEQLLKEFGTDKMPLGKYKHTSISCHNRFPTWDEIKKVKEEMHGDKFVIQVLPPKSHYVNIMNNCFHLWELPL